MFEKFRPLIDFCDANETDIHDSFEKQDDQLGGSMMLDDFNHILGNEKVMQKAFSIVLRTLDLKLATYFIEKAHENYVRLFVSTENVTQAYFSEISETSFEKTFPDNKNWMNPLLYLISNFNQGNVMEILRLLVKSDVMLKIEIEESAKTMSYSQEYVAKMTAKLFKRADSEETEK